MMNTYALAGFLSILMGIGTGIGFGSKHGIVGGVIGSILGLAIGFGIALGASTIEARTIRGFKNDRSGAIGYLLLAFMVMAIAPFLSIGLTVSLVTMVCRMIP